MAIMLLPNWCRQTPVRDVMKTTRRCYDEKKKRQAMRIYEFLCRVSIARPYRFATARPTGIINRGSLAAGLVRQQQAACQSILRASEQFDAEAAAVPTRMRENNLRATAVPS